MNYSGKQVKVVFYWEGFPKQGSQGLIGNLSNKNQIVPIDCDASAIVYYKNSSKETELRAEIIDYQNSVAFNNAICHEGDSISTGTNDETIMIDFSRIPEDVSELKLTLDVFKSEKLRNNSHSKIHSQWVKIIDLASNEEIESHNYFGMPATGILHCGSFRKKSDGSWSFENYGNVIPGVSCKDDLCAIEVVSD